LWVADYFHEFRDLCEVLQQLERKAYAAIGKKNAAAQKFARAKSESNLQKRLQQYETAYHTCEQAMALYDQLAMCFTYCMKHSNSVSPHGRLRTRQDVRSELTLAFRHDRSRSTAPPLPRPQAHSHASR